MRLFEEFETIDEAVADAERILDEAIATYRPAKVFALFSGGHDSLTSLHLSQPYIDAAVHIDTGTGIPATRQFVEEVCSAWDVPLLVLETPRAVYERIVLRTDIGGGFPGPAQHHITYHLLKAQRLQEFQRDFAGKGERLLLVAGARSAESKRRMVGIGSKEHEPPRGRLGKCAWANPIVHWDQREMTAYARRFDLPRNLVVDVLHRSGECLCGAMANPAEMDEIKLWFPEHAEWLLSLQEKAAAAGKRFCKWGATPGTAKSPGPLCSSCIGQEVLL